MSATVQVAIVAHGNDWLFGVLSVVIILSSSLFVLSGGVIGDIFFVSTSLVGVVPEVAFVS